LKGNTNALDNLCYLTDPVVAGNSDFDHARWIHPPTTDHRNFGGVAQNHSGPTTGLRIRLSKNMKSATVDIDVFPIQGFRELVNGFTHLLAVVHFTILSFDLAFMGREC
jgi:hypothetical protein